MSASRRRGIRWVIPLFILPSLILYTLFFVFPAADAFRIATYNWSGFGNTMQFVGLANFAEALRDRIVHVAITNNFTIMLAGGTVLFTLALYFAVVLTTPGCKGKRLLRPVLFFPYTVNEVGVSFLIVNVVLPLHPT